jgi:hypothetical protein
MIADTLRDDLAEALWRHWADADNEHDADWSIVSDDEKHTWRGYADVALRFTDAQVAAERERIAAAIKSAADAAEAERREPRPHRRGAWAAMQFTAGLIEAARIARGQP